MALTTVAYFSLSPVAVGFMRLGSSCVFISGFRLKEGLRSGRCYSCGRGEKQGNWQKHVTDKHHFPLESIDPSKSPGQSCWCNKRIHCPQEGTKVTWQWAGSADVLIREGRQLGMITYPTPVSTWQSFVLAQSISLFSFSSFSSFSCFPAPFSSDTRTLWKKTHAVSRL